MPDGHYTRDHLVKALRSVGLGPGDTVFSHSNIGFFGVPQGVTDSRGACELILDAFTEVLGTDGTLIVPTFTYSFPDGSHFDPDTTASTCGAFTEFVRCLPDARRSTDPNVSVSAIGARADELTVDVSTNAYGSDSFAGRFFDTGGSVCNLNFDAGSTLVHYVEREMGVPYRFDKTFPGTRWIDGVGCEITSTLWVRHLVDGTEAEFTAFDGLARDRGLFRTHPVGRGQVGCMATTDIRDLITDTLPIRPWFLTRAGLTGDTPVLEPTPPAS